MSGYGQRYLYDRNSKKVANIINLQGGDFQFVGCMDSIAEGQIRGMTPDELQHYKQQHNLYWDYELKQPDLFSFMEGHVI